MVAPARPSITVPQAVLRVARRAQLVVDRRAALQRDGQLGCQAAPAAAAAAAERQARRRLEDSLADLLNSASLVRSLRRLNHRVEIRHLEEIEREHRLDDDIRVGVLRRGLVVGSERSVARLVQRLAGANRLNPHRRIRVLHLLAHQRGVERAESLERPQRVEPAEQAAAGPSRLQTASAPVAAAPARPTCPAASTSSCCAVSRHHPFGCDRCATSCAGVSFSIRGGVRSRSMPSYVRRQTRPLPRILCSWYCSTFFRRYVPSLAHGAPSMIPRYMSEM